MSKTKAAAQVAEPVAIEVPAEALEAEQPQDAAPEVDPAPEVQEAAPVPVRALVDDAVFGLKAGAYAEIPAESLEALKASGTVDDHPDAVAYAKGL